MLHYEVQMFHWDKTLYGKLFRHNLWSQSPYNSTKSRFVLCKNGKHGKIDPVGTDEIDPVKTA